MGLEGAVGGRAAFQWWRRTRRRAVAAEDVDDGGCGGLEGRGGSRTDVNLAVPAPARCSTRQQGKGGCGAVGGGRVTRVGGGGGDAARSLGDDDGTLLRAAPAGGGGSEAATGSGSGGRARGGGADGPGARCALRRTRAKEKGRQLFREKEEAVCFSAKFFSRARRGLHMVRYCGFFHDR